LDAHAFVRAEDTVEFDWCPVPNHTLRVALPAGRDQREWSTEEGLSAQAMARALIRTQDAQDDLPADWLDALARELEQRDPLTALEIDTDCPACGASTRLPFDLEAQLLTQLHARQRRTLEDVHRLASVYHWSEETILQLPNWRRRFYLAQMNAGHA
jgi:hypothetical protein